MGPFYWNFAKKDPIFLRLKEFPTRWGCSYAS